MTTWQPPSAKCRKCNDIITSEYPGHFVECKCGESFIDTCGGGTGLCHSGGYVERVDNIRQPIELRKLTKKEMEKEVIKRVSSMNKNNEGITSFMNGYVTGSSEQEKEIERLKKENKQLKQQLKKQYE